MGIQVQPLCCGHDIYFLYGGQLVKCRGLSSATRGAKDDYIWSKAANQFAIDYVNGKLYGAQMTSTIAFNTSQSPAFGGVGPILAVCNLDGSDYQVLVPSGGVSTFFGDTAMCACPSLDMVVMRGGPGPSTIQTCALDGSGYTTIYTEPIWTSSPLVYYNLGYGLCVNIGTGTLYFTRTHPSGASFVGQLMSCSVYGGTATVVVDNIPSNQWPWFGLSVDYAHAKIWFAKFSNGTTTNYQLCNMNFDGSGIQVIADYGKGGAPLFTAINDVRYNNGNNRVYVQGQAGTQSDALWSVSWDGTGYRSEITIKNYSGIITPGSFGQFFRLGHGWDYDFDQYAQ